MEPKNGANCVAECDDRPGDDSEALELEPGGTDPVDPDDEIGVTSDVDLDEIDVPIDVEFPGAETWALEALDLDDTEDEDAAPLFDEFDDEAEMRLLHELGIDLDAPDGEPGVDLELDLNLTHEDQADDGVAA